MSRYRLAVLSVLCGCTTIASAAERTAPKEMLRLSFSVGEFDPQKPEGVVKCIVFNNTGRGFHVPVGYDGGYVQLTGGGLSLRKELKKDDVKLVWLEPGKEQVVFELPLDQILMIKQGEPAWHWSWMREPSPPRSPIHRMRDQGLVERATFSVRIDIGGQQLMCEPVELKVKPAAAPAEQ